MLEYFGEARALFTTQSTFSKWLLAVEVDYVVQSVGAVEAAAEAVYLSTTITSKHARICLRDSWRPRKSSSPKGKGKTNSDFLYQVLFCSSQ